ncbi:hypothetical protein HM1_3078 [Heliomicrobium modesticaldum Ice1]|uniref:Uncharacterized protein n=1 Tax=Heliobacterium modesticaldum (strain ATCC 51547 / Ice1) TaxID=498761 RepID=B0TEA1_HELMI|nr:hypothetical protein [Heliomicrobium modesticaldum]ABZ85583.1 hypothetical protein HM1_3078 [Heliomicrobium modesticaldum Ice1]
MMTGAEKKVLLELISGIAKGGGAAEHEVDDDPLFLRNFLPLQDHRRALDPDTLLILGGRGTGKTELFRLLTSSVRRSALGSVMKSRALPDLEQTNWIAGFGNTKQREKKFPTPDSIEQFSIDADRLDWRAFWIGLMIGSLLQMEEEQQEKVGLSAILRSDRLPNQLRELLKNRLPELSLWAQSVKKQLESLNGLLDQLDDQLIQVDRWLFISYDQLDRLVLSYAGLAAPIRELLAFWLDRWGRWERIRPKIFLRTDLFREEFLAFPDASKLKAHQIRLEWSTPWLYQLLTKRLANSGSKMYTYLKQVPSLIVSRDDELGWMPGNDESAYQKMMTMMIGEFMGANPRKGNTFRWIPNHLQDADGRIAPRSFLKLFSLAAERELEKFQPENLPENRLLLPLDLQGALMETSMDRIRELLEEYPWLKALQESLAGLEVPAERKVFIQAIRKTKWDDKKENKPPAAKPEDIFAYLMQLGIVENRSDGRVNVPEIYLYGFQLKRRGGIKRPK